MAGGNDVDIQMEFTKKMTAGFFGGGLCCVDRFFTHRFTKQLPLCERTNNYLSFYMVQIISNRSSYLFQFFLNISLQVKDLFYKGWLVMALYFVRQEGKFSYYLL